MKKEDGNTSGGGSGHKSADGDTKVVMVILLTSQAIMVAVRRRDA